MTQSAHSRHGVGMVREQTITRRLRPVAQRNKLELFGHAPKRAVAVPNDPKRKCPT